MLYPKGLRGVSVCSGAMFLRHLHRLCTTLWGQGKDTPETTSNNRETGHG